LRIRAGNCSPSLLAGLEVINAVRLIPVRHVSILVSVPVNQAARASAKAQSSACHLGRAKRQRRSQLEQVFSRNDCLVNLIIMGPGKCSNYMYTNYSWLNYRGIKICLNKQVSGIRRIIEIVNDVAISYRYKEMNYP
jgi:hypothetical protein